MNGNYRNMKNIPLINNDKLKINKLINLKTRKIINFSKK